MDTNFEALEAEVMRNFHARTAAKENALRRYLAGVVLAVLEAKKWVAHPRTLSRGLAREEGIDYDHAARLMGFEVGGDLPLLAIVRGLDKLGYDLEIKVVHRELKAKKD